MAAPAGIVREADVYKGNQLAATLRRINGAVEFRYRDDYLTQERAPIATSLPLTDQPILGVADGVPAFFAGLLPEGRRLSALRRAVKTSADDDLSLLTAVGADTVGDVRVFPAGAVPRDPLTAITITKHFEEVSFAEVLAEVGIVDPVGLPGMQDKASLRMISLPIAKAGARFILKLDPPEYPHVVVNEHYLLGLARAAGVPAASARLVHDRDGRPGLLVERFDRTLDAEGNLLRLAVEDATQVLGLYPRDKYDVSAEQVTNILAARCAARTVAARDLYRQLVFAWLTGNGDQHAKNLAIVATAQGEWRVSPMYDVPTTLPYGDTRSALTIGGRRDGLSRRRMLTFSAAVGLPEALAERVLDDLLEATATFADALDAGALPFDTNAIRSSTRAIRFRRKSLA